MEKQKIIFKQIDATLGTLSGVRVNTESWIDSEVEEEEENCIFKIMEALYPFIICNHIMPINFAKIPLSEKELFEDLSHILMTITKEGFSPSPYLYVREKVEFSDSAALALKLFTIVYNHISETDLNKKKEWKSIKEQIPSIINKGIKFLLDAKNSDKKGTRWAGTSVWEINKKSYCNVYFTSEVASSFAFILKNTSEKLLESSQQEIEDVIISSCNWIIGQNKKNILYGDEAYSKGEINYFYYGLSALLDCYLYLNREQQKKVAFLFEIFLNEIKKGEGSLDFITYMDVPLSGYPKPIYYDDRSSIANIITILCKGRDVLKKENIFDEQFFNTLNLYLNKLLEFKDFKNDLWNKNNFLIYLNSRAIEALLYFAKFGQAIVFENLSEQNLIEALKSTLENPQIQQMFLNEINRLLTMKTIKSDLEKE